MVEANNRIRENTNKCWKSLYTVLVYKKEETSKIKLYKVGWYIRFLTKVARVIVSKDPGIFVVEIGRLVCSIYERTNRMQLKVGTLYLSKKWNLSRKKIICTTTKEITNKWKHNISNRRNIRIFWDITKGMEHIGD